LLRSFYVLHTDLDFFAFCIPLVVCRSFVLVLRSFTFVLRSFRVSLRFTIVVCVHVYVCSLRFRCSRSFVVLPFVVRSRLGYVHVLPLRLRLFRLRSDFAFAVRLVVTFRFVSGCSFVWSVSLFRSRSFFALPQLLFICSVVVFLPIFLPFVYPCCSIVVVVVVVDLFCWFTRFGFTVRLRLRFVRLRFHVRLLICSFVRSFTLFAAFSDSTFVTFGFHFVCSSFVIYVPFVPYFHVHVVRCVRFVFVYVSRLFVRSAFAFSFVLVLISCVRSFRSFVRHVPFVVVHVRFSLPRFTFVPERLRLRSFVHVCRFPFYYVAHVCSFVVHRVCYRCCPRLLFVCSFTRSLVYVPFTLFVPPFTFRSDFVRCCLRCTFSRSRFPFVTFFVAARSCCVTGVVAFLVAFTFRFSFVRSLYVVPFVRSRFRSLRCSFTVVCSFWFLWSFRFVVTFVRLFVLTFVRSFVYLVAFVVRCLVHLR